MSGKRKAKKATQRPKRKPPVRISQIYDSHEQTLDQITERLHSYLRKVSGHYDTESREFEMICQIRDSIYLLEQESRKMARQCDRLENETEALKRKLRKIRRRKKRRGKLNNETFRDPPATAKVLGGLGQTLKLGSHRSSK